MSTIIASFSGGKTSAYMTYLLQKHKGDNELIVVFANTGKEREETLIFVDQCDQYFGWSVVWVEADVNPQKRKGTTHRVVCFKTASRKGEPFEDVIKKYGLPNRMLPHCTRELKEQPIKSYIRSLGLNEYRMAIGIRTDEMDRINFERADRRKIIYPLATSWPTTKDQVNLFWEQMPFSLNLKEHQGNCDCCWKKSAKKLQQLSSESPELFDWWKDMELKYQYHNPRTGVPPEVPYRMYRERKSATDYGNGCEESCEAFN